MTGQQFKFATVDAKAPDHDILAQMRVSCMNGRQTFQQKWAHLSRVGKSEPFDLRGYKRNHYQ